MSIHIKIQISKNKQHLINHSHYSLWVFSAHVLFYNGEGGLCFILCPIKMKLSTSIAKPKKPKTV